MTVRHLALAGLVALSAAACRGQISEDPPVHLVPDMDWQPKYLPQGESAFFEDGRVERPLVEGTVARGNLKADDAFYRGKQGEAFVAKAPVDVSEKTLRRGQERFNIYCAPCHAQTGAGNGLVVQHGYPLPVNLASDHTRGLPDGELFDIISHGVRNMPAYGPQIPEQDRWAIVTWVRVLQRSQHASIQDVPPEQVGNIEAEEAQ